MQRPSTTCSRPAGSTYASAHTYANALPAGASSSSFARFSASVACSPAKRAERTPGAPPSAADSMPESSAIAGARVAAAAARALASALAANVAPVSGGSSTSGGSGTTAWGASSAANSRALCALRVASTSRAIVGASDIRG